MGRPQEGRALARFLTEINETVREAPAEMVEDEYVSKALTLVEESAYTDAELYTLDRYWDWVSRERTLMNAAARRGAEGFEKGLAPGRAEGHAEGRAEGRAEERIVNARKMIDAGIPEDLVLSTLGLAKEDLR